MPLIQPAHVIWLASDGVLRAVSADQDDLVAPLEIALAICQSDRLLCYFIPALHLSGLATVALRQLH